MKNTQVIPRVTPRASPEKAAGPRRKPAGFGPRDARLVTPRISRRDREKCRASGGMVTPAKSESIASSAKTTAFRLWPRTWERQGGGLRQVFAGDEAVRRSTHVDLDQIADAVWWLEEVQGEKVSVRRVHALVGGSFRDVARLLREWRANKPAEAAPPPACAC
jgi:Plasmid replication region DNA-binding N-term